MSFKLTLLLVFLVYVAVVFFSTRSSHLLLINSKGNEGVREINELTDRLIVFTE